MRQAITYTHCRTRHASARSGCLMNEELLCAAAGDKLFLRYIVRMTSLHLAVLWGVEELVQLPIERGDNVNARTGNKGITPLRLARACEHEGIIGMLVEGGAT
ncbi:hypothetical protein F4809DRAFT_498175 [Biscogniauxia mediterranea]|nr:hypothetical protein F4809DRAFT_498175 [Biscogniauxia mediterranea]